MRGKKGKRGEEREEREEREEGRKGGKGGKGVGRKERPAQAGRVERENADIGPMPSGM